MKLAPQAVAGRKMLARRDQRVEVRREESGNASLSGRELDTAAAMASKAYIDAIAARLRGSGLVPGTLGQLRALALTDLTQGRNPLDRIKPPLADGTEGRPNRTTDPAPVPALINLLVPAGTALGWGTAPAQAAGWGLLDAGETQAILQAAVRHPRTRWCFTLTAPDGTAVAHACAKGEHPFKPPGPPGREQHQGPGAAPAQGQAAQLADLLRGFERSLRAHRQGHLRSPARRRPIRPGPQAQAPAPCPQPDLHRTRLQRPGRVQRPRPHGPVSGRPHGPVQPEPEMPAAVESAWGAVPGLLPARFPRPLAEPAVRLSRNGLSMAAAVRRGSRESRGWDLAAAVAVPGDRDRRDPAAARSRPLVMAATARGGGVAWRRTSFHFQSVPCPQHVDRPATRRSYPAC